MLDEQGRPRFEAIRSGTPTLYIFDVLRARRTALLDRPLEARLAKLEQLLPPAGAVSLRARTFDDGVALLAQCEALRLEGVVAKTRTGTYRCGVRSRDWRKHYTGYGRAVVARRMRSRLR